MAVEGPARLGLFGLPLHARERVAAVWPEAVLCGPETTEPYAAALVWQADDAQVTAFLDAHPECRWLHTTAVGVPAGVLRHAVDFGMTVTNGAGTHGLAVAEHVLALLLAHFKRLPQMLGAQRERQWQVPVTAELHGRRAGVLGLGDIGRRTAALLRAFGVDVVGCRRGGGQVAEVDAVFGPDRLADFLSGLDILVVAAPLTEETAGLVGAAELKLLRTGAVVVNVGRGPVVDEEALLAAVRSRQLGGVALDVFATEPLPASSPLWSQPGVLVTPHCADATEETAERCLDLLLDNVVRFRSGLSVRNVFDPARGY